MKLLCNGRTPTPSGNQWPTSNQALFLKKWLRCVEHFSLINLFSKSQIFCTIFNLLCWWCRVCLIYLPKLNPSPVPEAKLPPNRLDPATPLPLPEPNPPLKAFEMPTWRTNLINLNFIKRKFKNTYSRSVGSSKTSGCCSSSSTTSTTSLF